MIVILLLGNTPWLRSRRKGPVLSTALKSSHAPAPPFQLHLPQSLRLMCPVFSFTRWQYLPFCLCTFKILFAFAGEISACNTTQRNRFSKLQLIISSVYLLPIISNYPLTRQLVQSQFFPLLLVSLCSHHLPYILVKYMLGSS